MPPPFPPLPPPTVHPHPGSWHSRGAATTWDGRGVTSWRLTVMADASEVLTLGRVLPCVPLPEFPRRIFETALQVRSCS